MLPLAQYSLLEVSESVLLSTDTGTQEGTSNRATEAPTAEHDDDNSLGYTGTASCFLPNNTALYLPWKSFSQISYFLYIIYLLLYNIFALL